MRRVPRLIQVFARTPVMGRVKSRLAQDTDRFQALHGHRRLLLNSVTTAAACRIPLQYWCADAASFYAESWMTPLRRRQRRRQQACGGLGTRMHEALDAGFKSARSVVLIGSDCPELSVAYLHAAFRALEQVPVVIGPARDGGYVLIGINGLSVLKRRSLFRGIEWGSDQVMSQTLARLRRVGTSWACLPPLDDLDNVEALRRHAGVLQARPRVRWS